MLNSVKEQEPEDRHRWLAIPLWVLGVAVVGWGGLVLLLATVDGTRPWDGLLLSTALFLLLYVAFPVSLTHLVLVLIGRRVRRARRIVGVLLIAVLMVAFASIFLSAGLDPV